MSDLIDRQAAIDAIFNDKIDSNSLEIMTALGNGNEALTVNMTCDRHMQLLSKLPSAQPDTDLSSYSDKLWKTAYERGKSERKKGKWIEQDGYDGDIYYDCSVCGNSWVTIDGTPWDNGMNFCPNCGADMREKE